MKKEDIEKLRELMEDAPKGAFSSLQSGNFISVMQNGEPCGSFAGASNDERNTTYLLVGAANALPALLSALESAQSRVEFLEKALEQAVDLSCIAYLPEQALGPDAGPEVVQEARNGWAIDASACPELAQYLRETSEVEA